MTTNTIKHYAALALQHETSHNEGADGYNPYDIKHDEAVKVAADARLNEIVANLPVYRQAWNAAVAKYAVNGAVSAQALSKIEQEVGVTLLDMQAAKARVGV